MIVRRYDQHRELDVEQVDHELHDEVRQEFGPEDSVPHGVDLLFDGQVLLN